MIAIKYFCKRIIEIGKHEMHTFDWMLVFTIRYPYIHYYVRYESVDGDGGLFGNPTEDGLNASGMVGMVMRGVYYYTNIYLGKFKKTGLAINRNVAFSYIWFL